MYGLAEDPAVVPANPFDDCGLVRPNNMPLLRERLLYIKSCKYEPFYGYLGC